MTEVATTQSTEQDIARVAEAISNLAIYRDRFNGQSLDRYRPRSGSLMYKLWKARRLEMHHQRAWHDVVRIHERSYGASGAVTSGYGESTGGRNPSELRVPVAFTTPEYRQRETLRASLIDTEVALLDALIADDIHPDGAVMLQKIGLHRAGYANDDQGRACAIGMILALLERIDDMMPSLAALSRRRY